MQCDIKLWRSVALGGQMLVVVDVHSVCIHSFFLYKYVSSVSCVHSFNRSSFIVVFFPALNKHCRRNKMKLLP